MVFVVRSAASYVLGTLGISAVPRHHTGRINNCCHSFRTRRLFWASVTASYPPAFTNTSAACSAAAAAIMNGPNVATRSKRKEPPHHAIDGRHPKHLRQNGDLSSGSDNTPENHDDFEGEYDDYDDPRLQPLLPVGPDTAEWQATIESVVRNVVSIRFCQTCSFDTDPALTSEATGFVVDAERG